MTKLLFTTSNMTSQTIYVQTSLTKGGHYNTSHNHTCDQKEDTGFLDILNSNHLQDTLVLLTIARTKFSEFSDDTHNR